MHFRRRGQRCSGWTCDTFTSSLCDVSYSFRVGWSLLSCNCEIHSYRYSDKASTYKAHRKSQFYSGLTFSPALIEPSMCQRNAPQGRALRVIVMLLFAMSGSMLIAAAEEPLALLARLQGQEAKESANLNMASTSCSAASKIKVKRAGSSQSLELDCIMRSAH